MESKYCRRVFIVQYANICDSRNTYPIERVPNDMAILTTDHLCPMAMSSNMLFTKPQNNCYIF